MGTQHRPRRINIEFPSCHRKGVSAINRLAEEAAMHVKNWRRYDGALVVSALTGKP